MKRIILSFLFISIPILLVVFIANQKLLSQANERKEQKEQKEQGIMFTESSWNKVLQEAKKQNKLIFIDAYASWCGPCRMLKRNTFPDKKAGYFFNKNFINTTIDMEQGEGVILSQKFGVEAYPTLIIADTNGIPVAYTKGYITPQQLIEFGQFGLNKYMKK
jgi:thioredoxin 1